MSWRPSILCPVDFSDSSRVALRYAVAIHRRGGFSKPVALRLSGLPRGTQARWIQQDGTRAAVLPGGAKGAVLTLRTTRGTPTGTRRITLHTSGGAIQRRVQFVARTNAPGAREPPSTPPRTCSTTTSPHWHRTLPRGKQTTRQMPRSVQA